MPLDSILAKAIDDVDPELVFRGIAGVVKPARLLRVPALDRLTAAQLTLVCETEQHTGSFKLRAALAFALFNPAPRLITGSSGNFGAALCWAAARTGKHCTVVMPNASAQVKIDAVRRLGGTVELVDTRLIARSARVAELAAADPRAAVASPYDDPYVICGNASLGLELLRADPPEALVVPVGGGGLASGQIVAAAIAMGSGRPACAILGAEPANANDAARSLRAGRLLANAYEPDTLCDGARTLSLGRRNFAILSHGLRAMIEVQEDQIVRAVSLLARTASLRVEPTGALALAAVLSEPTRFAGTRVACIVSGGNVDDEVFARLTSADSAPAPAQRAAD